MRDEVLMQLVRRAQDDPGFRQAMLEDPDRGPVDHGIELEPDELAAVRDFHRQVGHLPEEELHRRLSTLGDAGEGLV